MCGIAAIAGQGWRQAHLDAMVRAQHHRGPDRTGLHISPSGVAGLGHNRLSIIDLSAAGSQPMSTPDGRLWLSYNGEIYNYLELRDELSDYPFRSRSDSEVILAAFQKWGPACLDRFVGMFALTIWDEQEQSLFGARDRFGVKPMYYSVVDGSRLLVASEIKSLHAAGVAPVEDATTWATYLALGYHDATERTFWQGVQSLLPGHAFIWRQTDLKIWQWYDLAAAVGEAFDGRSETEVSNEYLQLLRESVRLRFRADVPGRHQPVRRARFLDPAGAGPRAAGSGQSGQGVHLRDRRSALRRDTVGGSRCSTGRTIRSPSARSRRPMSRRWRNRCRPSKTSRSAACPRSPTRGCSSERVRKASSSFSTARAWTSSGPDTTTTAQRRRSGPRCRSRARPTHPCDPSASRRSSEPSPNRGPAAAPFGDRLRNLQYRDTCTKIPRALRFNDRISMRVSTELREPFLDHRLFELALRQGADRKIAGGTGKWLLRQIAASHLPGRIVEAPKRPLQTPQREWLRGPLREWATALIDEAVHGPGAPWLDGRGCPGLTGSASATGTATTASTSGSGSAWA